MSIQKEPRQMMINMMYLVLTAMLALNISAEILNAFSIVKDGLDQSNVAIQNKNDIIYSGLIARAENDANAVKNKDLALEAKKYSDNLIAEIDRIMLALKEESGTKTDKNTGELILKNGRDTHTPSYYLINEKHGYALQDSILIARMKLLDLIRDEEERIIKETELTLNALEPNHNDPNEIQKDWVQHNFEEVPVVAAMTILTKLKNDVKTSESDIIEYLGREIDFKFVTMDEVRARAISNRDHLNLGEKYVAEIYVSAFNSAADPIVYYGKFDPVLVIRDSVGHLPNKIESGDVPLLNGYRTGSKARNGIVDLEHITNHEGNVRYQGVIGIYNSKSDKTVYYPFEKEYTVSASSAVVSPDNMNVLYIGVDNPISVSAPGYQANQVTVKISQGSLTKKQGGKYDAVVTSQSNRATVEVWANQNGTNKKLSSTEFRVKRIPVPTLTVMNLQSGYIPAARIRASNGILASSNDAFDNFNLPFKILSFKISRKSGGNVTEPHEVTGPGWDDRAKQILRGVKPGDRIWLDNIRIKDPSEKVNTYYMSFKIT